MTCAPLTYAFATDEPERARIHLCGSLVAQIDGRRVEEHIKGARGRQLFACLVLGRRRPLSRDELIEAIWGDCPPADPPGALAVQLARLRVAIGHERVRGRADVSVELGDDAWIDWEVAHDGVAAAEHALAANDPRAALAVATEALEIARRPLLPGLSTSWLQERRRELEQAAVALLESAGRAALILGGDHLAAADRHARELIQHEPYRESGYGLLMEIHAARGNPAEALLVFDTLRRLLREELGVAPAPTLTRLAERLLDAPPDSAPPLPAAFAGVAARGLAGRRDELRALLRAVREPRRVVCVSGEPGIGKTRLAAEAAAALHREGVTVLHGRAARGGVVPFQPIVEALRGLIDHDPELAAGLAATYAPELASLAAVVPPLRAVAGVAPAQPSLIGDAAAALLNAAARRHPVLLVLEDLHWADPETPPLLRHVWQATLGARVTVLATLRDDVPPDASLGLLLVDLHREHAFRRIVLEGLDHAEIAELTGEPAVNNRVRVLHARSGGNPFYLEELLASPAGSETLRAAVRSRLDALPAQARDVLVACAGEGPSFELSTVARDTGISVRALMAALTASVRARLIVADPDVAQRFSFRHGIVWQELLAS